MQRTILSLSILSLISITATAMPITKQEQQATHRFPGLGIGPVIINPRPINVDKLSKAQLYALTRVQAQAMRLQAQALDLQKRAIKILTHGKPPHSRVNPNKYFHWSNQQNLAVVAGYDANGAVKICHANYKNGVHPGQLINRGCRISYAGKAFISKKYQILNSSQLASWKASYTLNNFIYNDKHPIETWYYNQPNSNLTPVVGGHEANGNKLYICRVLYKNSIHVGKVVTGACDIGYRGKELRLQQNYQVLFFDSNKLKKTTDKSKIKLKVK